MMLSLLGENDGGSAPSAEDLTTWAERFGLTFPCLSDPGFSAAYALGFGGSLPTFVLLGRDLRVLSQNIGGYSVPEIEEALAAEVPEVAWNEPPDLEAIETPAATGLAFSADGSGAPAATGGADSGAFGGTACDQGAPTTPSAAAGLLLALGAATRLRRRA